MSRVLSDITNQKSSTSSRKRQIVIVVSILAGIVWSLLKDTALALLPHGEDLGYLYRVHPWADHGLMLAGIVLIAYTGTMFVSVDKHNQAFDRLYTFMIIVVLCAGASLFAEWIFSVVTPQRMP